MSLLDDKLDYSIETKRLIKSAIQSKGQAVSDQDTLRSYAQKIRNITDINAQTKTVTPTTSQQEIEPVAPYNTFDKVIVNAVTSSIDPNIVAGNIKKGVTILGVTGTLESIEDLDTELTALENQTQLLEDTIDDKTGNSE